MRSKRFVIPSAFCFLLGFGALAFGWHGNANVALSDSLAGNAVQFSGAATGLWVIVGVLG